MLFSNNLKMLSEKERPSHPAITKVQQCQFLIEKSYFNFF